MAPADDRSGGPPFEQIEGPRELQHALRCARIATRNGVPRRTARIIAFAAAQRQISQGLAFALVEQESTFQHVFGHDPGGPFPGQPVTRTLYRQLVDHVRGGTSNGVGLTQITFSSFLTENPGLWRRLANKFGLGLISAAISAHGKRTGLAVYNGGEGNPQFDYADSVLALEDKWRGLFE
jgi:hypothetical protein